MAVNTYLGEPDERRQLMTYLEGLETDEVSKVFVLLFMQFQVLGLPNPSVPIPVRQREAGLRVAAGGPCRILSFPRRST